MYHIFSVGSRGDLSPFLNFWETALFERWTSLNKAKDTWFYPKMTFVVTLPTYKGWVQHISLSELTRQGYREWIRGNKIASNTLYTTKWLAVANRISETIVECQISCCIPGEDVQCTFAPRIYCPQCHRSVLRKALSRYSSGKLSLGKTEDESIQHKYFNELKEFTDWKRYLFHVILSLVLQSKYSFVHLDRIEGSRSLGSRKVAYTVEWFLLLW